MFAAVITATCFFPMWLIEALAPGRAWPTRKLWIARALAFNLAQVGVVAVGAYTYDRWFPGASLWSVGSLGVVTGGLLCYVVITFVYYWWHRARHEVPLLWRCLHQVHHSPQRLEVLTSFYKHPAEIMINGVLSSAIVYLVVGATPEQAAFGVLLTGIAELFYHWNVKTPYWLGFVIQRPESHCVHHERGKHTHNFSDLPLWDMLFGTFSNPREDAFECGFDGDAELDVPRMLFGLTPREEMRDAA
ncbi:MAG: sterol desaturase family protein [Pseudomonadota bacterium]